MGLELFKYNFDESQMRSVKLDILISNYAMHKSQIELLMEMLAKDDEHLQKLRERFVAGFHKNRDSLLAVLYEAYGKFDVDSILDTKNMFDEKK